MGDWPQVDGQRFENAGANTTITGGTVITAAGSANTKGSYTELIASTAFHAHGITVNINNPTVSVSGDDFLIDIGIGAATEEVLISNLHFGHHANAQIAHTVYVPISVPAGSRLSARCQCETLSATVDVSLVLHGGGFIQPNALNRCTTYGANTADSGGVSVDPGAVNHTKGAYSEVTASTTNPIKFLIIGFANQSNGVRGTLRSLVDIGIGAATEEVLIPNMLIGLEGTTDSVSPKYIGYPCNIPAGSRLTCRSQASDTIDATDRRFDVILYGVD